MNSILLKIFTTSPSAKSGGKLLNLLGYSVIKSIFLFYEKLRKLSKPNLSQKYNQYLLQLDENGFVVIENFMSSEDFENLKLS